MEDLKVSSGMVECMALVNSKNLTEISPVAEVGDSQLQALDGGAQPQRFLKFCRLQIPSSAQQASVS